MESYFPDIELNTETWNNIHSLICHATHAYSNIKYKCEELENSDKKTKFMEEQIKTLEEKLERVKYEHKTKICLDEITSEVRDELTRVIGDLIWFIQPEKNDRNDKGTYNPKIGPNDYNKVLGKICFHYIF